MNYLFALQQSLVDILDSIFPKIAIYTGEVPQTLERPAFILVPIDTTMQRERKGYFWYYNLFSLTYHPSIYDPKDMAEKRQSLLNVLHDVPYLGKVVRAKDAQAQLVDETLVLTLEYALLLKREPKEDPLMGSLGITQTTKGD